MSSDAARYRVLSPLGVAAERKQVPLAPGIADFAGRTVCAMRHLFRADETFPMLERLFAERFPGVRWVSNHDMPDERIGSAAEEEALGRVLRDRGCDLLLAGNAN